MSCLDRPIVVVGAPRSGTTLLAETILARHPDVAYWPEPVFVWRYGNAYRSHDVFAARHATDSVRRYIRRRFREYASKRGAPRFLEKTPSNSLRLQFVLKVLPDARVVHVIRDGRDAAYSSAAEWSGPGQQALEYPDLREGGRVRRACKGLATWLRLGQRVDDLRSFLELPAYTGRFLGFLARHLLGTDRIPWGPRFPGLLRLRATLTLLETCAIQWMVCVQLARSAGLRLSSDQYLEVRYEELVSAPSEHLERIMGFADLRCDSVLLEEMAAQVAERNLPRWPEVLPCEEVEAAERHIAATLQSLNYPLLAGFDRCSAGADIDSPVDAASN